MTLAIDREGERFVATTDCPACGHVATHYLDKPRREPTDGSPMSKVQRLMARTFDTLNALDGNTTKTFDAPGTTVARECVSCAYRWGQT